MKTWAVGEFKAHFSEALEEVKRGGAVAVAYGRKKEKVAVMIPYNKYKSSGKRKLGILKGKASCHIGQDFELKTLW